MFLNSFAFFSLYDFIRLFLFSRNLKYLFVSSTTIPDSPIMATRFGIAISPFTMSASVHISSSLSIVPDAIIKMKTTL